MCRHWRWCKTTLPRGRLRPHSGYTLRYGAEIHVIAVITGAPAVHEILAYLNEPTSPLCFAPVRGPPLWETAHAGQRGLDPKAQPAPDQEFDHSISASCGKNSLTRTRSRSTGNARASGYQADLPRPVG
jgi:hypothetical protein